MRSVLQRSAIQALSDATSIIRRRSMEIDAPAHCIAVWIEGDNIMVRLPDHQLLDMKSPIQLMNLLQERAKSKRDQMTVGTKAAPVQYDIDTIAAHLNGHTYDIKGKSWDDLAKEAGDCGFGIAVRTQND
jgi:hypothetical protein